MGQALISRGKKREVLPLLSRANATIRSEPFALQCGGGIIITVIVTNAGAAGSLDTLNVQAKEGSNYDTIATFTGLAITAAGRHRFRIAPGATRAAGANAYKGVMEDVVPAELRIQTVHSVNAMTYQVKVELL